MFVIKPDTNTIQSLNKKTFSELNFRERQHLQEWIASKPTALGEELLIIQKEFNGFNDTNERLDLLALDKKGNLVIIENKLDDSGRDVTWQALKYASYCSSLTKDDILSIYQRHVGQKPGQDDAVRSLESFFNKDYIDLQLNVGISQRIIFIAANFRKEVTSTVLWLMNYNIQLQCFKVSPFEHNGQYFLTLEQIIPVKDAQDYIISLANKKQIESTNEEGVKFRDSLRYKFWANFLQAIQGESILFQNLSPTDKFWMRSDGTGIPYLTYVVLMNKTQVTIRLNFGKRLLSMAKILFDTLQSHKDQVEEKFGGPLLWDRKDDNIKSHVEVARNFDYTNEELWPQIFAFAIENLNKLEAAVRPFLNELKSISGANMDEKPDTEKEDEE